MNIVLIGSRFDFCLFEGFVCLSVKRCASTQRRCSFGDCSLAEGLATIPRQFRLIILKTHRVFIPAAARFCSNHTQPDTWENYGEAIHNYTKEQIEEMLELLLNTAPDSTKRETDHDMRLNTGLDLGQFNQLFLSLLPYLEKVLKTEDAAKTALLAVLKRLRTGHTYEQIRQSLGGMTHLTLKKYINAARDALLSEFVPKHLGFENLTREFLVENTTEMARYLYCGGSDQTAVVVWDGTYSHGQN